MGIRYEHAEDVQVIANEISKLLFPHVRLDSIACLRSFGSSTRGTIARCHALGKAMQIGLNRKGFYVIEVISERFDRMPEKERIKTIIHELMHIPKTFGGGFKFHDYVCTKNVDRMYEKYIGIKNNSGNFNDESFNIENKHKKSFDLNLFRF
jgi:predicted metallopeptidase